MSGTTLRFVNTLILSLIALLGITGLYGLVWPSPAILFEIHRTAAWGLILLIPWKTIITLRSLKRGLDSRPDRNLMIVVSLILAAAALTVIFFGLVWKWNLSEYYFWIGNYAYTPIGWHWGIAIGLAPFFLLHVWRRWPRPKRVDFTKRRQALKLLGLGAAAVAGWSLSESLAKSLEEENTRRFTGSRESGSFSGLSFPITHNSDQGKIRLHPETWRLRITGAVSNPFSLTYSELLSSAKSQKIVTLDCTGGWYTTQAWGGVPLSGLLEQAQVRSRRVWIRLKGIQDYHAQFSWEQAQEIILATHVGGLVLDHNHGYPLRAVVPSRRGWHWVKWMTEIEVVSTF